MSQANSKRTRFEQERDALVSEIAVSMNNVLNNLNALNRSLEGVVAVGKEFESVSLLWNNYYDGLARVEIHQQQEQQQQQQHEQQQQHQENAQPDEPRQSTDQQGDVEPSGI